MRFESSVVVILAASITIAGCSPFQRDRQAADGSFRQAPTSELMAMAERYERQGEYAHAARLYEELLNGDPNRAQARERLRSLATYGVVSPHVQEALAENVEMIVADHQRQSAEHESQIQNQPDGMQRELASIASHTSDESLFTSHTGTAQLETAPSPQTAAAPVVSREFPPAPSASHQANIVAPITWPAAPTSPSEVPDGPAAWHSAVIRPQQSARPTDDTQSPRSTMTQLDSTGSNLWRSANQPETNDSLLVEEAPAAIASEGDFTAWASAGATSADPVPALASLERSDAWMPRTSTIVEMAENADPFRDPIRPDADDEAVASTEPSDIVVSPLQQAQDAFTLWRISGDATQSIPVFVDLLQHEDAQVVEVTCYLLGELGPAASVASASLQALQDSTNDEATAIIAAEALVKIDPASNEAVDRLVQASRSTDQQLRLLAAMTLASVDHSHEAEVVPALARMLDDESADVRSAAALSLGGWGEAAFPHTSKLEELALSDTTEVSEAARISLQCLSR